MRFSHDRPRKRVERSFDKDGTFIQSRWNQTQVSLRAWPAVDFIVDRVVTAPSSGRWLVIPYPVKPRSGIEPETCALRVRRSTV